MTAYHEAAAKAANAEPGERVQADLIEMKTLYELKLGRSLSDELARASFAVQSEMRELQSLLIRRMDDGDISAEECADRFEDLLTAAMIQNRVIFDRADFNRIFGEDIECYGMIDRDKLSVEHEHEQQGRSAF